MSFETVKLRFLAHGREKIEAFNIETGERLLVSEEKQMLINQQQSALATAETKINEQQSALAEAEARIRELEAQLQRNQ
ncbi:MAG: hypothetical protein AAF639_45900 [Chloroflexota bacterium]